MMKRYSTLIDRCGNFRFYKSACLLVVCLGFVLSAGAQDIHFSQWQLNPLQLNPGMSGMINSNLRASATYRDQWNGLAPFTTIKAAADGNIDLKNGGKTRLTVGGMIFKDKAGDVDLSKFQLSGYLGAIMELNNQSDLSVGLNLGFFQRSLDSQKLIWDAQYVGGQYNAANPDYEDAFGYSISRGDIGAGVAYRWNREAATLSSNDFMQLVAGLGFQHVNRPNLTFAGIEDRMFRKFAAHADLHFGIRNSNFSFRPGLYYVHQGPHQELVAGTYSSVLVREPSKRTGFISAVRVSLGTHVRGGDAFITSLLLEMSSYKLGFAYDITSSELSAAGGTGAFEISFVYLNPAGFYYKKNHPGRLRL